jgi:hypothetical protein
MPLNIRPPAADQGRVIDVSDPDRLGKIVGAGPEQSEVKFDDGAVRVISNVHPSASVMIDKLGKAKAGKLADEIRKVLRAAAS